MTSACFSRGHTGFSRNATLVATVNPPALAGGVFNSSPVRVFVFFDRVEIISPGHLPNNLTVENIKAGNSNTRNPILASYANHILPYRGYGSGIIRALEKYQHIDFIDDRDGNVFKVIFKRKTQ